MKKQVFLGIVSLFIIVSVSLAQGIPEGIVTAFKKGNSVELNRYLGDKVSLVLPTGRPFNLDKQQATAKIKDFLDTHRVQSFVVKHQSNRDGSSFMVGIMTASNGTFRVNCFLKKIKDQCLIHQIRIEKVNE